MRTLWTIAAAACAVAAAVLTVAQDYENGFVVAASGLAFLLIANHRYEDIGDDT